jgi:RimJ/RimL family protein N-acetyltransferase
MKKSLKIRPITKDDFPYVLDWSKDEHFCKANQWELNREEDELFEWWLHCVNPEVTDFVRLGIEYEGKLIGYSDLVFLDKKTAELGIAIGGSTMWGKGLGTTAALLTMEEGRKIYGITVFEAETHEDNFRSRKMLENLGFKEVSRKGKEIYLGRENQLIQYRLVC